MLCNSLADILPSTLMVETEPGQRENLENIWVFPKIWENLQIIHFNTVRFSIIFTIHFGLPLFLKTPILVWYIQVQIEIDTCINSSKVLARQWKNSKTKCWDVSFYHETGQIVATSHDLTTKCSLLGGKSPYFREI